MRPEFKKYYQILGENVAFYRKRKKLTQEQLAEMVECENIHISHIETGYRGSSLDVVFAIADSLGVEPYKLFQNKD